MRVYKHRAIAHDAPPTFQLGAFEAALSYVRNLGASRWKRLKVLLTTHGGSLANLFFTWIAPMVEVLPFYLPCICSAWKLLFASYWNIYFGVFLVGSENHFISWIVFLYWREVLLGIEKTIFLAGKWLDKIANFCFSAVWFLTLSLGLMKGK
jgi:hypothetical protein